MMASEKTLGVNGGFDSLQPWVVAAPEHFGPLRLVCVGPTQKTSISVAGQQMKGVNLRLTH